MTPEPDLEPTSKSPIIAIPPKTLNKGRLPSDGLPLIRIYSRICPKSAGTISSAAFLNDFNLNHFRVFLKIII